MSERVIEAARSLIALENAIEESGKDDVDGRWNAYCNLESALADLDKEAPPVSEGR